MHYKTVYPETNKKVEEKFAMEIYEKFNAGKLEIVRDSFDHWTVKENGQIIAEVLISA